MHKCLLCYSGLVTLVSTGVCCTGCGLGTVGVQWAVLSRFGQHSLMKLPNDLFLENVIIFTNELLSSLENMVSEI